jgi:hypothetical protein
MTCPSFLLVILLIVILVSAHRGLKPDPEVIVIRERFAGELDKTPHACAIADPQSAVSCSGGPEGWYSQPEQTGWHNSVSRAGCGEARKETPEGWRVFKKPNYYGQNMGFGYGYGEPYYARKTTN